MAPKFISSVSLGIFALKGAPTIAASGIIGKVKAIKGEYISLEVSENVVFKLQRSAIANILPKGTIESIK